MSLRTLHELLPQLARCRRPTDVGGVAVDAGRRAFGMHLGCAIFLDEKGSPTERTTGGLSDADFDEWDQDIRQLDRVFPAMLERAIPVHNWQLYSEAEWRRDPGYVQYGRRLQIYNYLAAPIFGSRGTLVGALTFCRRPQDRPFDGHGIALASALSGFISASLARVTEAPLPDTGGGNLTERELQMALLAAAGQNNLQISLRLGLARETVKQTLRRVYRKLDVTGRAQMAAELVRRGLSY